MIWSKKYKGCKNCGTERFPHKARGYCARCYGLIRKLEIAKSWSSDDETTLREFPKTVKSRDPKTILIVQHGYISQVEQRLSLFSAWETQQNEDVDAHTVELQIRRLAQLSGARNRNLHFGIAGFLEMHFNTEQLGVLFTLLNDIEQSVPWSGIDYAEIFRSW